MWMDGERVELRSPHDAHARGIRTVYQELTLVPQLSVTENLLMGHFPRRRGGLIDRGKGATGLDCGRPLAMPNLRAGSGRRQEQQHEGAAGKKAASGGASERRNA